MGPLYTCPFHFFSVVTSSFDGRARFLRYLTKRLVTCGEPTPDKHLELKKLGDACSALCSTRRRCCQWVSCVSYLVPVCAYECANEEYHRTVSALSMWLLAFFLNLLLITHFGCPGFFLTHKKTFSTMSLENEQFIIKNI